MPVSPRRRRARLLAAGAPADYCDRLGRPPEPSITGDELTSLLTGIALVALLAHALGRVARRLGQPAVVGEIVLGIVVGPPLFGGAIARDLLPPDLRPSLGVLATVGLVFFMFCVGLELDQPLERARRRTVGRVSAGSIGLPIALGSCLAVYLARDHAHHQRPAFVLFIAAAMSVTAFPVLARILADRRMLNTDIGQTAMACAGVNDVVAWTLLTVAVALAGANGHPVWRILALGPYVLVMLGLVRPLARRLAGAGMLDGAEPARVIVAVVPAVLLSAAASNWMGLTPVFGAFFLGAIMPPAARAVVRPATLGSVEPLSRVILLPIFFVTAGLQVNLDRLDGHALSDLALILTVAVVGKFGGTFIAARSVPMASRESAVLGALMNARGVTELVVLSVGLQLGIIDRSLYSVMVVMAVLTTAMAGPLLSLAQTGRAPGRRRERPILAEESA